MTDQPEKITDAALKKLLPKGYVLPKGLAARADLLYKTDKDYLEAKKIMDVYDKFYNELERWFIQELPAEEENVASGVAGKLARVQVKRKEIPMVEDWPTFYTYIKKNNAFELLNKAVNTKAVNERWANKKTVPGVNKFIRKTVSLTKVK